MTLPRQKCQTIDISTQVFAPKLSIGFKMPNSCIFLKGEI